VLRLSFTHNNLALEPAVMLFHCRLVSIHDEHIHFLTHTYIVRAILYSVFYKTYNYEVLVLGPIDCVKGLVHPKMKIKSLITHPHAFFLSF